jgi:hypothetical protein
LLTLLSHFKKKHHAMHKYTLLLVATVLLVVLSTSLYAQQAIVQAIPILPSIIRKIKPSSPVAPSLRGREHMTGRDDGMISIQPIFLGTNVLQQQQQQRRRRSSVKPTYVLVPVQLETSKKRVRNATPASTPITTTPTTTNTLDWWDNGNPSYKEPDTLAVAPNTLQQRRQRRNSNVVLIPVQPVNSKTTKPVTTTIKPVVALPATTKQANTLDWWDNGNPTYREPDTLSHVVANTLSVAANTLNGQNVVAVPPQDQQQTVPVGAPLPQQQ